MEYLEDLFERNRRWAEQIGEAEPGHFERLAKGQHPKILWIGCADSRVPPNEIVGLHDGELFVHRNIANVVPPGDINVLSVLQYAVETLRVQHVVVCGHYGCGGVRAALEEGTRDGALGVWLGNVATIKRRYREELAALDEDARFRRLCELNARSQVNALAASSVVLDAWERGQPLFLHAWIYDLGTGLLHDLHHDLDHAEVTASAV